MRRPLPALISKRVMEKLPLLSSTMTGVPRSMRTSSLIPGNALVLQLRGLVHRASPSSLSKQMVPAQVMPPGRLKLMDVALLASSRPPGGVLVKAPAMLPAVTTV